MLGGSAVEGPLRSEVFWSGGFIPVSYHASYPKYHLKGFWAHACGVGRMRLEYGVYYQASTRVGALALRTWNIVSPTRFPQEWRSPDAPRKWYLLHWRSPHALRTWCSFRGFHKKNALALGCWSMAYPPELKPHPWPSAADPFELCSWRFWMPLASETLGPEAFFLFAVREKEQGVARSK